MNLYLCEVLLGLLDLAPYVPLAPSPKHKKENKSVKKKSQFSFPKYFKALWKLFPHNNPIRWTMQCQVQLSANFNFLNEEIQGQSTKIMP